MCSYVLSRIVVGEGSGLVMGGAQREQRWRVGLRCHLCPPYLPTGVGTVAPCRAGPYLEQWQAACPGRLGAQFHTPRPLWVCTELPRGGHLEKQQCRDGSGALGPGAAPSPLGASACPAAQWARWSISSEPSALTTSGARPVSGASPPADLTTTIRCKALAAVCWGS